MSFDYYKKYADDKVLTPQKNPQLGKKSAPRPVLFTESTQKRKKTVTKNNQIVDKNKKEVESITMTPYKAKRPEKSPAKILTNTQPKIAKTPAKTHNKVQNNKNTTTKTPAKTVKNHTNTSPNKTTKEILSPTKKTAAKTNLKSKRPVKKSKNLPLEFRISTEEAFKNHFQLVTKNELEKNMKNNRICNKVNNYLESFLTIGVNDNDNFLVDPNISLGAAHNFILADTQKRLLAKNNKIVVERLEWEELLTKLNESNNSNTHYDDNNNDFVQKGLVKFSKLKKKRVKPDNDNIKQLIEDILLQSDNLSLQLIQNDVFMKKGDKYCSNISNLIREKELQTI